MGLNRLHFIVEIYSKMYIYLTTVLFVVNYIELG